MSVHRKYLRVISLGGMLFCGSVWALTQSELESQIQGMSPEAGIQHLQSLNEEVHTWPPGEQIAYYRLVSELQRGAAQSENTELAWLLVFLLGSGALALIVFSRRVQPQPFTSAQADSLTKLYNQSTIFDIGKSLFKSAISEGRNLSAIVFEVDDLGAINDRHGEAVGDQMLQLAALNARQVLRGNDCIGRIGGDEFLVVLPNTGLKQAIDVAERIRSRLERHPLTLDEFPIRVTISLAIAENQRGDDSFKSMTKRANATLLEAQEKGKNRVVVAR